MLFLTLDLQQETYYSFVYFEIREVEMTQSNSEKEKDI